jgi:hypothetical protein
VIRINLNGKLGIVKSVALIMEELYVKEVKQSAKMVHPYLKYAWIKVADMLKNKGRVGR